MDGWNDTATAPGTDKNSFIGKKPNKIIPVPDEYRRLTSARERDTLVNDLKVTTNCTVVPRWEQGKICRFDIYSSAAGVEHAIRHLNQWISTAHARSKDSSAWPKIPAFEFDQWYYEEVAEMEDARTQMFKEPAPQFPENAAKPPHVSHYCNYYVM